MMEQENLKILKQCPRFNECSVPICPLDYYQSQRVKLEGEPKCTLAKSIRMRIAKGTELKYQGMTKREWDGKKRWDAKPEAEKQIIIERGKKILQKVNQQRV